MEAQFICPRCGEDRSELAATWTDSCPLSHVCTECGLAFRWRDAFAGAPRWWIEARPRLALHVLTAPFLSLAPWWLWKRLPMAVPPRFVRLLLPYVLMWLAIHVVTMQPYIRDDVTEVEGVLVRSVTGTEHLYVAIRTLACGLLDPIARVPTPPPPPAGVMARWRTRWLAFPDGTSRLYSQITWRELVERDVTTAYFMTAVMASVAAFALLPFARRRASVRWRLIVRAGLVIGWTAVGMLIIAQYYRPQKAELMATGTLGLFVWLGCCWYPVIAHHLHMRRAWLVTASVAAIGALAAPVVFFGLPSAF